MGYIAKQVRKLLKNANVWSGQQTFAGGISGAIQPGSGKTFYVDATSGSVGAAATSWSTAEKSIEGAYGRCVDGRGDTIYIQSRGSSSAATTSYLSSTLTWHHGYRSCSSDPVRSRSYREPEYGLDAGRPYQCYR